MLYNNNQIKIEYFVEASQIIAKKKQYKKGFVKYFLIATRKKKNKQKIQFNYSIFSTKCMFYVLYIK